MKRSPENKPYQISFTEVGGISETTRKTVRASFIANERAQTAEYIKNLEQTLAINKEIISEMMGKNQSSGSMKSMITKLNNENGNLQNQLKKVIKDRNEAQSKLLIAEQLVENYKKHEIDACKDLQDKQIELVDQLNRKEYFLQNMERKYARAISLLTKFAHKDQEIKKGLKELKADIKGEQKVTNVVEENTRLSKELAEEKEKNKLLEKKIKELEIENLGSSNIRKIIKTQINERNYEKNEQIEIIEKVPKLRVKRQNDGKIVINSSSIKLDENGSVIKKLTKEISELKQKTEELYSLNIKLSSALAEANDKLSNYQKYSARPLTAKGHNRSVLTIRESPAKVSNIKFRNDKPERRNAITPNIRSQRQKLDLCEKEIEQGIEDMKKEEKFVAENEEPKIDFDELSSIREDENMEKNNDEILCVDDLVK